MERCVHTIASSPGHGVVQKVLMRLPPQRRGVCDMPYLHRMDVAKNHIPGIYNYCDRWCERCAFTARCAVYEMSETAEAAAGSMDAPEFWETLQQHLAGTVSMIHEMMKAQGMDPDALPAEGTAGWAEKRDAAKAAAQSNPLQQLSTGYMETAMRVLVQYFRNGTGDGSSMPHGAGVAPAVITVDDCLEIIRWYVFFIPTKIQRALRGKAEAEGEEPDDEFPPDYDGSAKVALIAVERSMSAWALLLQYFPALEDDMLPLLVSLEKMKGGLEKEFPGAHLFVRPGFDE